MIDLLFARTFLIVAGMLGITALTARANKAFETKKEMWLTLIPAFILLFVIQIFADSFPLNLILVGIFSALMGWSMGPAIESISAKKRGPASSGNWSDILSQALGATALAVLATACMVFLTNIDFGFLGAFLFIALLILIIMGVVNIFFIKSERFQLIKAYLGVLIFTGYLLFDFNRLEKLAHSDAWSDAIRISVSLYLDIINLFLSLLAIFADSN